MTFRTIKTSEDRFSSSGLTFYTVKSQALGGRVDTSVYVPPQCERLSEVPVIILLHGVYGSHWSWALNAGAHISLQKMIDDSEMDPCVLVMPSDGLWGDGSAYVKQDGGDFERWIADELPDLILQEYTCVDKKSKFFIGGLSMGGWGALWVGIRNPEVFSAISAHSAITDLHEMEQFVEEDWSAWIEKHPIHSITGLLESKNNKFPPLRFDCGKSDALLEGNRKLDAYLKTSGQRYIYQEFEGDHEWPYWEEHIRDSYDFFNRVINMRSPNN